MKSSGDPVQAHPHELTGGLREVLGALDLVIEVFVPAACALAFGYLLAIIKYMHFCENTPEQCAKFAASIFFGVEVE